MGGNMMPGLGAQYRRGPGRYELQLYGPMEGGPTRRGLVSDRPSRGQTPTSPPADPSSVSRGTPSTTTPLALLAQKLRLPSLLLLHVDLLAPNYLGASVFVVGALAPLTRAARLWVLSFALFP